MFHDSYFLRLRWLHWMQFVKTIFLAIKVIYIHCKNFSIYGEAKVRKMKIAPKLIPVNLWNLFICPVFLCVICTRSYFIKIWMLVYKQFKNLLWNFLTYKNVEKQNFMCNQQWSRYGHPALVIPYPMPFASNYFKANLDDLSFYP